MTKPFDHTLRDIRYGECLAELSEQFGELIKAVENTQRGGQIALTIKIKPAGGGRVDVTDDIKAKIPQLPKGTSIFFVTPDNNLVRNDPRQPDLSGLKSVDASTGEIKTIKEVAA